MRHPQIVLFAGLFCVLSFAGPSQAGEQYVGVIVSLSQRDLFIRIRLENERTVRIELGATTELFKAGDEVPVEYLEVGQRVLVLMGKIGNYELADKVYVHTQAGAEEPGKYGRGTRRVRVIEHSPRTEVYDNALRLRARQIAAYRQQIVLLQQQAIQQSVTQDRFGRVTVNSALMMTGKNLMTEPKTVQKCGKFIEANCDWILLTAHPMINGNVGVKYQGFANGGEGSKLTYKFAYEGFWDRTGRDRVRIGGGGYATVISTAQYLIMDFNFDEDGKFLSCDVASDTNFFFPPFSAADKGVPFILDKLDKLVLTEEEREKAKGILAVRDKLVGAKALLELILKYNQFSTKPIRL